MINLERENSEAEREYDLTAFDADPRAVYELAVCSNPSRKSVEEEIFCEKQTMSEIRNEISLLGERITPDMERVIVLAYEVDDLRPVPAYLVLRKDFHN